MRFAVNRSPAAALPIVSLTAVAFIVLMLGLASLKPALSHRAFADSLPATAPKPLAADHAASVQLGLRADANGNLVGIALDGENLGQDAAAFNRLRAAIRNRVARTGNPLAKNVEVEITADPGLHYRHVIRVVVACTGEVDPQTNEVVRAVETIRFTPPPVKSGA